MNKQFIEISINNEVVVVSEVKECNPLEFIPRKKQADANFKVLIDSLLERIAKLENEVKVLKGED